jgi:hypothetical protein
VHARYPGHERETSVIKSLLEHASGLCTQVWTRNPVGFRLVRTSRPTALPWEATSQISLA